MARRGSQADPGAVARIARILVDNALRFGPAGGRIALTYTASTATSRTERARRRARRPRRRAQLIFERFRRGRASAENGAGFGLGLAIGRELAEQMGGDLQVVDAGSGACFVLSLAATVDP